MEKYKEQVLEMRKHLQLKQVAKFCRVTRGYLAAAVKGKHNASPELQKRIDTAYKGWIRFLNTST